MNLQVGRGAEEAVGSAYPATLEFIDEIVQSLAVAQMALELEQTERCGEAVRRALGSARQMVSELSADAGLVLGPGDLRRSAPAVVR